MSDQRWGNGSLYGWGEEAQPEHLVCTVCPFAVAFQSGDLPSFQLAAHQMKAHIYAAHMPKFAPPPPPPPRVIPQKAPPSSARPVQLIKGPDGTYRPED